MRKIKLLAITAMMTLVLTGCGNNSSTVNISDVSEQNTTTNISEETREQETTTQQETTTHEETTEVSTIDNSKQSESVKAKEKEQETIAKEQEEPKTAAVQTTESTQPKTTAASRVVSGDPAAQAKLNMDYYQEVLTLVNQIRAEAGVSPLTLDPTMCYAATTRAMEMDNAKVLSHTRPNGSKYSTALTAYGIKYSSSGENIASGANSPEDVVTGWKNSPAHYSNMIKSDFKKLGVGFSNANGRYWVQMFTD